MSMSQAELFKRLGAPLHNVRWSWGSVRPSDGSVFLRVWQDRMTRHDGRLFFMATHHDSYQDRPSDLGYQERLRHVAKVRAGAGCYMVMCLAENTEAIPRTIKSFNRDELFVAGAVREIDGDTWIEMAERVSVARVVEPPSVSAPADSRTGN